MLIKSIISRRISTCRKAVFVAALSCAFAPQVAFSQSAFQDTPLAAEGRRQLEILKQAYANKRITLLEYYKGHYTLDKDYFQAPPAMLDLDLWAIMMAKNVELGRITKEEFDYLQNKKIEETAKRMTTFD